MASNGVVIPPLYNGDVVNLTQGMIVRQTGGTANTVVRAQADSAPNSQGVLGVVISGIVAPGGVVLVESVGRQPVLLETGLTLTNGETIFLSATAAGRGTNVEPGIVSPVTIGTILDTTLYTTQTKVVVSVLATVGAAGTGFPGYGVPTIIGPNVPQAGTSPLVMRADAKPGQNLVAQWALGAANRRVYLVDPVNGVDDAAHAGFLDGGSSIFPISPSTIAATAKKSVEALDTIFPRIGNGRTVEVIIANGGVNTTGVFTGGLQDILTGCVGYDFKSLVRGTGTNTTAGAVAFAGDTADCTYLGGVTCAGCNANGYTVIGTPTTSVIQLQKNGGGAAALPSEPSPPLGWRMRGDSGGARNANACRNVAVVAGTDTITVLTPYGVTPQVGDVFYLEQAGVQLTNTNWNGGGNAQWLSFGTPGMQLAGIMNPGSNVANTTLYMAFCGSTAASSFFGCAIASRQTYAHPTIGTLTVGGGYHNAGNYLQTKSGVIDMHGHVCEGTITVNELPFVNWKNGCVAGVGAAFQGCSGTDSPSVTSVGSAASEGHLTTRIIGSSSTTGAALSFNGCKLWIGIIDVTGSGARPAVLCVGSDIRQLPGGVLTGTTGNTDAGLSFCSASNNGATGSTWSTNGNTNTLTGTAGDVRLGPIASTLFATWAALADTGIVDQLGNRINGGTGRLGLLTFTGVVIGGAGAVVSYLADAGIVGAVNQTTAFRRQTSTRIMMRLFVTNITNTSANAITVTLYKNGSPTAMQVSIPAASGGNTKFEDLAHPIFFADTDDFDLRCDDAADVGGSVSLSAGLEYA